MTEVTTLPDWTAIAPALALLGTAFVLLLADMIDPDDSNGTALTGISVTGGLVALGFALWYLLAGTGQPGASQEPTEGAIELFGDALVVDGMSLFFSVIITSVVVLVALASHEYLREHPYQAEYYSLVLLASTGMVMVTAANSFVTAFISIELVSLPSYALVASLKTNEGSVEGGLKYFLIGALSSAIFAYGIALVYVATGSLQFGAVEIAIADGVGFDSLLGLGMLMILGGIAFKIAAVPFHFWAPDAYEGAPAPISAFISSASKAAGFVLGFRVFVDVFGTATGVFDWVDAFLILSIVTMTIANFTALKQDNVKRILAYSSVAHAGYILIALAAFTGSVEGEISILGAGMAHLFVYGFMNTGAFLFIALAEYWDVGRTVEDYHGLGNRAPFACAAMTVFLFSLAGLPIGGGFFSKFYLLFATVTGGQELLGAALIINSVVSLFYYTRIVRAIWIEEPGEDLEPGEYPTGLYAAIAVAALATILLIPAFGFVIEYAEIAARMIGG
ncbi:NADH-quinone oxidoreductase subunit NuoN [Halovenus sp. WSH3]|uniref:NADH-quinone oxidoreductase subunit NuoN n=1 Tax=Halovenus carboxidivorans TaxID=2692199 RepID=A0A6B0T323_9EURY|nr:NADH-quinone oxidoreductase subunit N [Halovenus carboxidivorans]MXR51517.1 NADH-quinone oxidoreductase subunit NuoN [Halovenus carboxidivorans]